MNKYATDLPAASLNALGQAVTAGWLTVYSIEPVQREYQQASMEFLAVGVGLPALSFADKPEIPPAGFALVRSIDGAAWETKADYRGKVFYSTASGEPVTIEAIGDIPKDVTSIAPATPFDAWNGKKWVTDKAAQRQDAVQKARVELSNRQQIAAAAISPLEKAVKLDIATDEEKRALTDWETYSVLLNRVNVDVAPDIEWPDIPA